MYTRCADTMYPSVNPAIDLLPFLPNISSIHASHNNFTAGLPFIVEDVLKSFHHHESIYPIN